MKIMLISDEDDVNSGSFFQPPEHISTLKRLRNPDLRVDNSDICWSAAVEKVLYLFLHSISLKSQVHIWFCKHSDTVKPSQHFHGNRTFGECYSSVGKAKVEWGQKKRKVTPA